MGIHGEPGASTIATHNSAEIMQIMVEKLTAALPETGRLAVMLNNLGGGSGAERAILTRELANTPLHARVDWLIGPASLVTALDMKGFSLTTIVLEESIEKALLSDVETASWQKPVQPRAVNIMPSALASARVAFTPSANPQVGDYVAQVTSTLSGLETHLNALDAKVGDGDTGSTFAAGAREIAALLQRQQLPLNDLPTLFALIGERLTVVMGGSSGVLMSIFFTAAGQKLEQGASMAEALNAGLGQMKFYGGADEGDRTMIDALQPALAALLASAMIAFFISETLPVERRQKFHIRTTLGNFATLFRHKRVLSYMLASGFSFAGMFSFLSAGPFVYININHVSPQHFGYYFALNIVFLFIMTIINSRFVRRVGALNMFRAGLWIQLAMAVWMVVCALLDVGFWSLVVGVAAFVGCVSMVSSNAMAVILDEFPHMAGTASSLAGTFRFGIGAIIGALLSMATFTTAWPMLISIAFCAVSSILFYLYASRRRKVAH